MDRQIYPEGHSLASLAEWCQTVTRGTDLSIHTLQAWWNLFLARLHAAKLDFHSIYLKKRYNHSVRHFELKRFDVIVTCALNDKIMWRPLQPLIKINTRRQDEPGVR